ncbi:MAG: leucyl aminopeptidase, partial [Pseudomonadota bacterium]
QVLRGPDTHLVIVPGEDTNADLWAAHLAYGVRGRCWRFNEWMSEKSDGRNRHCLTHLAVVCEDPEQASAYFAPLEARAKGCELTRDLVSQPPNILYPESFAERCAELEDCGLSVEIFDEAQMQAMKMNALLGVGQGSARASRMVVMRWKGAGSFANSANPVAFVGKGVTFDTGGISLKPGPGMEEMKWDMGGAGVVTGLMKTLALRKAPVDAVGLIGLVENMPDGNAQRPGDIVRSMSGQTVEIHNTDAEGRLVLADVLHYACTELKPKLIIDLATLTGAMIIALGHEYAGLFSNDDALAEQLMQAGLQTGDKVWRMPLAKAYDKLLKSDCADMKNIGGRAAGSITAAQFLQRFIGTTPWAHLDIAGVTWQARDGLVATKGASGFGVALLDQFVKNRFEG